jgi:ribonuclease HI
MGETLTYAPRKAVKSQILADFIAEWIDIQLPPPEIQEECWLMYFDGSVMKTVAGADLLFVSPLREHMQYVVCLHFPVSNNMAEYEALLSGLRIAIELGIKCLDVRGDSQLIIDQVTKEARCHNEKMEAYCNVVRRLEDKFNGLELNHIACKYNEEVDELAKIASGRTAVPPNVFARDLTKPSVDFKNPAEAIGAAPEPSRAAAIKQSSKDPSMEGPEAMDTDTETSSMDEAEAMEIDEALPP